MLGERNGPSANVRSIFVVMEEVDRILLQIAALMIVSDNHADIFVSGHALHLTVGETQIERARDGRAPQIVGREL
jgi:hypothetical protein